MRLSNRIIRSVCRKKLTKFPYFFGLSFNTHSKRFLTTEKFEETPFVEELSVDEEKVVGEPVKVEYQSETRRLLDIVTNSLYKNQEIFIRELISNASDAIEKERQQALTRDTNQTNLEKYQIKIFCDEKNGTFTIQDNGCGMSREELQENIGTICYSGSEVFRKQLEMDGTESADNLIGQFGVGFYSVFMVSDEVKIFTKSRSNQKGYFWKSKNREATFELCEAENVEVGTKIILKLKEGSSNFSTREIVKEVIQNYSNFISYDIFLNGERVDTLEAIWLKPKNEISSEEHEQFYSYLSHSSEKPFHVISFETDIPLSINSIFYVPQENMEKFGLNQMEMGVNIYSNKVLIDSKNNSILPHWMRFLKGCVDSEDLPLNISRESIQNNEVVNINRMNKILTKKIINSFGKMMNDDFGKYQKFYDEFEKFLKEGITTDYMNAEDISKLLIFETSKTAKGERITFNEYLKNMKSEQNEIYFLVSTSREVAEKSPYYEVFKENDVEVVFSFNPLLDDFVFASIGGYEGKNLVSIEHSSMESKDQGEGISLTNDQTNQLIDYIKNNYGDVVQSVEKTSRLSKDTPAIILNPENPTVRLLKKMQDPNADLSIAPQQLAINPKNNIIINLFKAVSEDRESEMAKVVVGQVIDNAFINANLIDDPRLLISRMNRILELALNTHFKNEEL